MPAFGELVGERRDSEDGERMTTTRRSQSKRTSGLPAPLLAALYLAAVAVPLALAGFSGIESAGPWSEAATA